MKEKNFHFWWPGPDDVMRPLYCKNGLYQKGTKRIFDLHRLKYQNQQKDLQLANGVNFLSGDLSIKEHTYSIQNYEHLNKNNNDERQKWKIQK